MRSMRSAQCQVDLRWLGNQLPVFSKANSLCKIVKFGVFCLFVKLWLSPNCVGPGIKISRVIVARAKSMTVAPLDGEKILTPAFYAFVSALSHFFVRWCWHLWKHSSPRLVSPALPLMLGSCKLLVIAGDSFIAPSNLLRASCRFAAFRSMLFTITDCKRKSHDDRNMIIAFCRMILQGGITK